MATGVKAVSSLATSCYQTGSQSVKIDRLRSPKTIDSQLSGNWFPAASSHSKEEEEEDNDKEDEEEERIAVECSNQST